jgi:hypothetical protein
VLDCKVTYFLTDLSAIILVRRCYGGVADVRVSILWHYQEMGMVSLDFQWSATELPVRVNAAVGQASFRTNSSAYRLPLVTGLSQL